MAKWGFLAYRIISIVGLLSILILFTACGRNGFIAEKGTAADYASNGVCESQLKSYFERTYFPLLSTNCNNCHSSSHGSKNLNSSFSSFMSKGESLIEYKATHPHGDNGVNLTTEIAALKPEWNAGQEEYLVCLASNTGDGSGRLRVDGKAVPAIQQTIRVDSTTGLVENVTGNNAWKPVEWDIEADVPVASRGQFQALLKAEARFAVSSGEVVGFEVRNPTMRLKNASTGNNHIRVDGMNLFLDDQLQFNVTTYTGVSKVVDKTTEVQIAAGSAYAMAWFPEAVSTTSLAFEFSSIQITSEVDNSSGPGGPGNGGTIIRYNDLISTDPEKGIFRNICFACHNQGPASPAGLDLADYTIARGKIAQILNRINSNDPSFRMPLGGTPLTQAQKDIIANWSNNQTPQ